MSNKLDVSEKSPSDISIRLFCTKLLHWKWKKSSLNALKHKTEYRNGMILLTSDSDSYMSSPS